MLVETRLNHRHSSQAGWAMVEMALTSAIVILLITTYVMISNQIQEKNLAQRTAQEMNGLLAAAVSYYHDHDEKWPDDSGPTGAIKKLIEDGYIVGQPGVSKSDGINPWGKLYKAESVPGMHQSQPDFEVATCVPDYVAHKLQTLVPYGEKAQNLLTCPRDYQAIATRITTASGDKRFTFDIGIYSMTTRGQGIAEIPKPKCTYPRNIPTVYVMPAVYDTDGYAVSGVSAYAKATSDGSGWIAHIQAVTSKGIMTDTADPTKKPDLALAHASVIAIRDCKAQ
ncbi:hypothetical protein M9194_04330 [Vibrio sp. S4M6]|uniref:hypothetical protein n=1 Tax=Vibrio sinus TaxID=2946865 RepID=UPI00202A4F93|nr:hypothetical protein [Vibrio sinus]MCL9780663.1 hypothetical protein [Vibrio sinus]